MKKKIDVGSTTSEEIKHDPLYQLNHPLDEAQRRRDREAQRAAQGVGEIGTLWKKPRWPLLLCSLILIVPSSGWIAYALFNLYVGYNNVPGAILPPLSSIAILATSIAFLAIGFLVLREFFKSGEDQAG